MNQTTQDAPTTCPNRIILNAGIDALYLSRSSILDLGALFKAIESVSKEYSTAGSLAKIGMRLVLDQTNFLECERERLEELQRKLEVRS